MFRFLQQPYPVNDSGLVRSVVQALLVGIFVAFVLIIFQPFGAYNWQHAYKLLILSGYGLVASLTTFLNFYVFVQLFPSLFIEKKWMVWKEIIWNVVPIVLGGFLCTVYGYLIGAMPFTFTQVSYMMSVVFLVGLFPTIIMVLLNYVYLIRKYAVQTPAEQIPHPIENLPKEEVITQNQLIQLVSENEKDKLVVLAHELLFIEASDNYCTVVYVAEGKVNKMLLRSSLSRLESQIHIPQIIRCHRSYIANFQRIQSVSGNAQGYKLHFEHTDYVVPVARSYSAELKPYFALA